MFKHKDIPFNKEYILLGYKKNKSSGCDYICNMRIEQIDRGRLYWVMQCFGWSLFFIVYTTVAGVFIGFQWQTYASYANAMMFGLLFSHLYRLWIKKYEWENLGLGRLSINIVIASIIVASLISLVVMPVNYNYFQAEQDFEQNMGLLATIVTVAFQFTFIMLGWSLMYFVFHFFVNFKKSEVEKWRLEAAVKDAELIALKSQINPHFIFNSLNNIRALVIEDAEKARDMITHLSDLLRYSVQFNAKAKVCIEDELEVVENYLNLESIQYEDRLSYTLEIQQATLEYKIPPMAIQLLVENAIKHGISELPKGGEIRISTKVRKSQLIVEVKNTGRIQYKNKGTGIGLTNIAERLKLVFGTDTEFNLRNTEDNMVSAKFVVPLNV